MAQITIDRYDDVVGADLVRYARRFEIRVTWPQILLSAITIGRANWRDVTQFGFASGFDIAQRVSILLANVRVKNIHGKDRFQRTDRFDASDPTEKTADLYRLGLAFAGLIASREYDVRWLMHLDVYFERYGVKLGGRSRPDLFGQDRSGDWAVIEAKARSSPVNDDLRKSAKKQCRRVLDINGVQPRARAGIISWFDREGILNADLVDPALPSEDALPMKFSLDWFVAYYYARFIRLLNEHGHDVAELTVDGQRFTVAQVASSTLEIGVLRADPRS
jgi:hypothetical protein